MFKIRIWDIGMFGNAHIFFRDAARYVSTANPIQKKIRYPNYESKWLQDADARRTWIPRRR